MLLSLIIAMDELNAIGFDNKLPWHLPAEMKIFKETTTGHHVIMGRKTWEAMGKPLRNRTNIVVTRQETYSAEGAIIVHSLDEAIQFAKENNETEAFVIGGAKLAEEALPLVDKIYYSVVHHRFGADTYFPVIDLDQFNVEFEQEHWSDKENPYTFTFRILSRKK